MEGSPRHARAPQCEGDRVRNSAGSAATTAVREKSEEKALRGRGSVDADEDKLGTGGRKARKSVSPSPEDVADATGRGEDVARASAGGAAAAARLRVDAAVLVRRSDGRWARAAMARRTRVADARITLRLDGRGCIQSIRASTCVEYISCIQQHRR